MAKTPASILLEAMFVLLGRESPERFATSLIMMVLVEVLLTHEVLTMELIYIPEGMLLPVILVLAVMAVFGPILCALYKKNEGKGKYQTWTPRYIATMFMDMLITPSLGMIVMSFIVQEWFVDINDMTYLVFLPIVLLTVSYFALTLLNEGIKATVEQIKKVKGEIDDATKELKQ